MFTSYIGLLLGLGGFFQLGQKRSGVFHSAKPKGFHTSVEQPSEGLQFLVSELDGGHGSLLRFNGDLDSCTCSEAGHEAGLTCAIVFGVDADVVGGGSRWGGRFAELQEL